MDIRKVKFELVRESGSTKIVYPDNSKLFTGFKIIDGSVCANYSGDLSLELYDESSGVVKIVIDNLTKILADFDDKDNQYTVVENSNSIATGTGLITLYNMGLKKFRVPFVRLSPQGIPDSKRYMVADIALDGSFSILINFKTGGEWQVNTELLNSELSEAELALFSFSIAEHKFKVV